MCLRSNGRGAIVVGVECSLQLVGMAGPAVVVVAVGVLDSRMTWCGQRTLLMAGGLHMDWQTSPLWWGTLRDYSQYCACLSAEEQLVRAIRDIGDLSCFEGGARFAFSREA